MTRQLSRALSGYFKPAVVRAPRASVGGRAVARALAEKHGVELEQCGSGVNVWPPKTLQDCADPFGGDHYAESWADALERVQTYAQVGNERKP